MTCQGQEHNSVQNKQNEWGMSKQMSITLRACLQCKGGSAPGYLEGEWDPWLCHHLRIYSSCCLEHNSQRCDIHSRGSRAQYTFRAKSVTRAHIIPAATLLHARCTNICYDLACISFFSGKSFSFSWESASVHAHSFIQQIFFRALLCDRYSSNCWGDSSEQNWQN